MNAGSIFIHALGVEARVTLVRLRNGMIEVHAVLHGPATLPVGSHESVIYGEEGMQIAVMQTAIAAEMTVQRGEHLDLIATLAVGSVESGTVPVS